MKYRSFVVMAGLVLSAWCGAVLAEGAADTTQVGDPYVRAVPPGQGNSASFMTIINNSSSDHALVAAESTVSEVVELHTHTMVDGMMQMRQVDKIDLPAGQSVTLQPGGLHVMLIGLKQDLVPEQNVDITLVFEDGSKQQITAPIRKLQMKMKPGAAMGHMQH